MSEKIISIAADFWNIRGDLRLFGFINIGTHCSLVRLSTGKFVLLDAYTLPPKVKQQVDKLTNNGDDIEAIINLHPFHTLHVENAHEQYPDAKLFGTQRHIEKFPNLPWQPQLTESTDFAALYADDFSFSVPKGVDFISSNEHVHFSSVLAYHKHSKTVHSDDTIMYLEMPLLVTLFKPPQITFHITLAKALQPRAGAADEFRKWVQQIAVLWSQTENFCAAHSAVIKGSDDKPLSFTGKILNALKNIEGTLEKHARKYDQ